MEKEARIYVAGHRGLVGASIVRNLRDKDYKNILVRTHSELNLIRQQEVDNFFVSEKPDYVFLAAAKVGGIYANNTYPADFIYDNIMIEANVIDAAFRNQVKKLLFLGSSCIYPKNAGQPMRENQLLTAPLEPTNEPYAISKIAGIKLCESYNRQHGTDYRSIMPTNLYGPGDNYDPLNSHVIPALIRKFHEAKVSGAENVKVWGTGKPKREFLFVDDMAEASVLVMNLSKESYEDNTEAMLSHINVGSGYDISIAELSVAVKHITGYGGAIVFEPDKPDGTSRKLMDIGRISLVGWHAKTTLEHGLRSAYDDFLMRVKNSSI